MRKKYLNLELQKTLFNIKTFVEKLEAEEYYSDNSPKFLAILKKFVIVLQDNFDSIPPNYHQLLLSELNFRIIPLIRYVQRSQTKEVPWSLIPNFERIVHDSLGDKFIILLRPKWHWNYSVLVNNITQHLQTIVLQYVGITDLLNIDDSIHVISFPVIEKSNYLLHTVIGHEIGHFYQHQYFEENFRDGWETGKLNELIPQLAEIGITSDEEYITKGREVLTTYKGMVREIIPDLIGYLLLGPSMIFTLYHFSFWMRDNAHPSQRNNHYPPLKYRIRILYDAFFINDASKIKNDKIKIFPNTLDRFKTDIETYLKSTDDLNAFNSQPLLKLALKMFEKDKISIIEYCKNIQSLHLYTFDENIIENLIERINDTIPPNEVYNKPVELGDIFLSGWIYYYRFLIESEEGPQQGKDYIMSYEVLSKLLLKASNLAFVHSLYLKADNDSK